jgi:hypothetical protein
MPRVDVFPSIQSLASCSPNDVALFLPICRAAAFSGYWLFIFLDFYFYNRQPSRLVEKKRLNSTSFQPTCGSAASFDHFSVRVQLVHDWLALISSSPSPSIRARLAGRGIVSTATITP